jgi:hypothetical protein
MSHHGLAGGAGPSAGDGGGPGRRPRPKHQGAHGACCGAPRGADASPGGPGGGAAAVPWGPEDARIGAPRPHQLALEPRPRRHALSTRAIPTLSAPPLAPAARLWEGLHAFDGYGWCGGGWRLGFAALLGLKDLKNARQGARSKDAIGRHRDQPMGHLAQSAKRLARHLIRRCALLLIARLVHTHNTSPRFYPRLEQSKPWRAARRSLPGSTRQKVGECVRRVAPTARARAGNVFLGSSASSPRGSAVQ